MLAQKSETCYATQDGNHSIQSVIIIAFTWLYANFLRESVRHIFGQFNFTDDDDFYTFAV